MNHADTMHTLLGLVDKWDSTGTLPTPVPDGLGSELLSSRIRRAVAAHQKQKELEAKDPEEIQRRLGREKELEAERVRIFNQDEEERVAIQLPGALEGMGLEAQEIAQLADLHPWPAVTEAQAWWMGPKLFLVLGGSPGTGKTMAAASVLPLACIERMPTLDGRVGQRWTRRGVFLKAQELVRLQTYGPDAEAAWERLRLRALLVIDDLGTEAVTEHWLANLADLIDARMRRNVRTILTTNLPSKTLAERYGARVMRRLADHGRFVLAAKPGARVAG